MLRAWSIVVFGGVHKSLITPRLTRTFAFEFQKRAARRLQLAPTPCLVFADDEYMLYSELEDLLAECDPGEPLMLIIFFNDSESPDILDKIRDRFPLPYYLYNLTGEDYISCAQSNGDLLSSWVSEIVGYINSRENLLECTDTPSAAEVPVMEVPEITGKTGHAETPPEEFIDTSPVGFSDIVTTLKEANHGDVLSGELLRFINGVRLRSRLYQPFPSREENGQLLALLVLATSTSAAEMQDEIAEFFQTLFQTDFLQWFFFGSVAPAATNSVMWDAQIITDLQHFLQLMTVAKRSEPEGFDSLMSGIGRLIELLPEQFWSFSGLEKPVILESLTRLGVNTKLECTEEYRPAWMNCDEVAPPGDFRELPISLVRSDIICPVVPYLRRNKECGSYDDQQHYLDVQFRLMREDFVSPMRDGIALWKAHAGEDAFLSRSRDFCEELDLLVITGVQVEGVQIKRSTGEKIRYVKFNPLSYNSTALSQKLKFGQMVALSSDGFKEEALIATVVQRSDEQFAQGRIGVAFSRDSEVSRAKIYTMVESSSYYEMYQHVLQAMKSFNGKDDLPFAKYLVEAKNTTNLPAYLRESKITGGPVKEISVFGLKYPVDKLLYKLDMEKVASGIDDKQKIALCHALSSELAIIQGPPGTGKTFIGRLIVRILFENMELWNPARTHPLLVVCFTNHALDYFLEGVLNDLDEDGRRISDFPSVVRLGSRCANERVRPFMRKEVMENYKHLAAEVTADRRVAQIMLDRIRILEAISKNVAILSERKRGILSFKHVSKAISHFHRQQFRSLFRASKGVMSEDEILSEWLTMGPSEDDMRRAMCLMPESSDDEENDGLAKADDRNTDGESLWNTKSSSQEAINYVNCAGDIERTNEQPLTWKDIEEMAMRLDPDVDEFFHSGSWDLDNDENAPNVEPVGIFPPAVKANGMLTMAMYDREVVRRLESIKKDVLKAPALSHEEAKALKNINTIHKERRWMLYAYWSLRLKEIAENELNRLLAQYKKHMERVQEVFDRQSELVLRKSLVIGATTTGAAKCRNLLNRIGCRIVIIEEAAEVLEAHILTSIPEKCQQAILIGDHQQLRPSPSVFALAREYKLDISLFERLIRNNFPYAVLDYQHRMASVISQTLMPHFYPSLEDAENVKSYSDVKGTLKNLYFINHREHEASIPSMSHQNDFEANFAVELAKYFIKQGYECSQITLLCPYAAQCSYVRSLVQSRFSFENHPHVETVDNYQGEENDIVILTLVRSQPSDSIGFLGVPNRVCVALSRAKLGFYMIGNLEFLAFHSRLWTDIGRSLENADCISDAFPILCSKHGNLQWIEKPNDFEIKASGGGCDVECGVTMPCGHKCDRKCHSDDLDHSEPCARICGKVCHRFGHPCKRKCGEPCGKCMINVKKHWSCGHCAEVCCYSYEEASCDQPCSKQLPCGHTCSNKCCRPCTSKCSKVVSRVLNCGHTVQVPCSADLTQFPCSEQVERTFSPCGHVAKVECSRARFAKCRLPCGKPLPCGHLCNSECDSCLHNGCGTNCDGQCGKKLSCGHKCRRSCGDICELGCIADCENECVHTKCHGNMKSLRKCGEICAFCIENCANRCRHRACAKMCWQPCEVDRCSEFCQIVRGCGHRCGGLCGEACPEFCMECSSLRWEDLKIPVGSKMLQFVTCKCIFAVQEIDQQIAKQLLDGEVLHCPKCSSRLTARSCFRYAAKIKEKILYSEKEKYEKVFGDAKELSRLRNEIIGKLKDEERSLKKFAKDEKNGRCCTQLAQLINELCASIDSATINQVTADFWNVLLEYIADLSILALRIKCGRFQNIPKKRFPHLHFAFAQYFSRYNNIRATLCEDFSRIVSIIRDYYRVETRSALMPLLRFEFRGIYVKYQIGMVTNNLFLRSVDLTRSQLADIQRAANDVLKLLKDEKQKAALTSFMNIHRAIYDENDLSHMIWDGVHPK